jgi:hypothetical protein
MTTSASTSDIGGQFLNQTLVHLTLNVVTESLQLIYLSLSLRLDLALPMGLGIGDISLESSKEC